MSARKPLNDRPSVLMRLRSAKALPGRRPIRQFFGRLVDLRSDSSGVIAIMTALLMPFLAGGMGLGAETGYHYMQQRNLQHATDLAAHAGAVRLRAGDNPEQIKAAALNVAILSGFKEEGTLDGTITVHTPPTTGPNTDKTDSVEVILTETQRRYFSAIFIAEPVQLSTRAVASVLPSNSKACVLALSPTAPRALTVSGSAAVSLDGCDVASNSNDAEAFYMTNTATLTVGCVHTVGGASISNGLTLSCEKPNQYAPVVRDPYADVHEPSLAGMSCATPADKEGIKQPDGTYLVKPTFAHSSGLKAMLICDGFHVTKHVRFESGLYIIKGGKVGDDLSLNASGSVSASEASIGTNVGGATFYLTGTAKLKLSGNGTLNMSAPTSGPYAGMLFFASRTQSGISHQILGNSTSSTQGAIYAPSSAISFSGNSSSTSSGCTQVIGYTVVFTGNSTLKSNCETSSNAREIQTNVTVRITE